MVKVNQRRCIGFDFVFGDLKLEKARVRTRDRSFVASAAKPVGLAKE